MTTWNAINPSYTKSLILEETSNEELADVAEIIHEWLVDFAENSKKSLLDKKKLLSLPTILSEKDETLFGDIGYFLHEIKNNYDVSKFSEKLRKFIQALADYYFIYKSNQNDEYIDLKRYANLIFQPVDYVIKILSEKLNKVLEKYRKSFVLNTNEINNKMNSFIDYTISSYLYFLLLNADFGDTNHTFGELGIYRVDDFSSVFHVQLSNFKSELQSLADDFLHEHDEVKYFILNFKEAICELLRKYFGQYKKVITDTHYFPKKLNEDRFFKSIEWHADNILTQRNVIEMCSSAKQLLQQRQKIHLETVYLYERSI